MRNFLAAKEDVSCQYNLGVMYANGWGQEEPDPEEVHRLILVYVSLK